MIVAVFVVLSTAIGLIGRSVTISHALQNDPFIQSQFAEAVSRNKPLTVALEKYHRDQGFYPTDLMALKGYYEGSSPVQVKAGKVGFKAGLIYSAAPQDHIFKTPECAARQSEFEGWIMKPASEFQHEKAEFVSQCVIGYRQISLQSSDFHHDAAGKLRNVEQWAYYTSNSGQWTLGWCAHEGASSRTPPQKTAFNGVCRY
jgi:hypothetical protein